MPSALLKPSKGLRFLTLRRCGRPFSEIASAAGWADACVFLRLFEPRSSPPHAADCKPIPREPSASFHIFLFRKRKMNGISTEKSFVCDANHRLTARWHDAACCSSPELRGPQPPAAEARYSLTLIERTTAGCRPSTFAAKRRYLWRLAPLVRPLRSSRR